MTTHPKCGKTWSGHRMQHCPVCCETFSGEQAGDRHRIGDHALPKGTPGARRCMTPEEMRKAGLILDSRGIWAGAEYVPRPTPTRRSRTAEHGSGVPQ
jgi:hypothetical protein